MSGQRSDHDNAIVPAGGGGSLEAQAKSDWEKAHPSAGTIAALEFQVGCLLRDRRATLNWGGREVVVNEVGDLAKKYENLRHVASAHFPSRGDVDDVLNRTIDEYGLWEWANPSGFWTAFKRDMIDAAKAACEAKRFPLERAGRTFSNGRRNRRHCYEWAPTRGSRKLEIEIGRKWLIERSGELHSRELAVSDKWRIARLSAHPLDRLMCEVVQHVMADEGYMDELAGTNREGAKMTRIVAEIRRLAGCSPAEAYRLLGNFKKRHTCLPKKS